MEKSGFNPGRLASEWVLLTLGCAASPKVNWDIQVGSGQPPGVRCILPTLTRCPLGRLATCVLFDSEKIRPQTPMQPAGDLGAQGQVLFEPDLY